jgi:zinc transporter ZupT
MVATRRQRAADDYVSPLKALPNTPPKTPSRKNNNKSKSSPPDDNNNNSDGSPSKQHDHAHHDHRGCPAHILKDVLQSSDDNDSNDNNIPSKPESQFSQLRSYAILSLLALITYLTYPGSIWGNRGLEPTIHTVFYYGWISAISTGFGVIPLCFVTEMKEYWIGVSNAIAAGMMMAASYSLFMEGCTFHDEGDESSLSSPVRTAIGCVLGLLFILGTKSFLEKNEDVKVGSLSGADTKKILLIVFVMTLHSFSEGVGIGVSFGGEHGHDLGVFISASLAVHNIPEGLAVAIVLLPRKVSKATAAIWCVVTSLPQPLMAVPAFMFVHSFLPLLPVGLGFAGGAMCWVAFMELLLEAYEDTDMITTGVASSVALAVMIGIQRSIDEHA